MKLNNNYVLRQVVDMWIVMPIGDATMDFNGVIKLNETGAVLWHALELGGGREELADALLKEYAVEREQAHADVDAFLQKLKDVGCLEI